MTDQQKDDYYYGYNIRLADELGRYNSATKQPNTLEGKINLCNSLKEKLVSRAREENRGNAETHILEEVFNDPIDEREQTI